MSSRASLAILVVVCLVGEVAQVPARGIVLGALEYFAYLLLLLLLPLRLACGSAGVLRVTRVAYDHLICRELPFGPQTSVLFLLETSIRSLVRLHHSPCTSAMLDAALSSIRVEPDLCSCCPMLLEMLHMA